MPSGVPFTLVPEYSAQRYQKLQIHHFCIAWVNVIVANPFDQFGSLLHTHHIKKRCRRPKRPTQVRAMAPRALLHTLY